MTQIVVDDKVITTKEEAAAAIAELSAEHNFIAHQIAELADAFEIEYVYLDVAGSYGTGAHYHDGEWQASSHSC